MRIVVESISPEEALQIDLDACDNEVYFGLTRRVKPPQSDAVSYDEEGEARGDRKTPGGDEVGKTGGSEQAQPGVAGCDAVVDDWPERPGRGRPRPAVVRDPFYDCIDYGVHLGERVEIQTGHSEYEQICSHCHRYFDNDILSDMYKWRPRQWQWKAKGDPTKSA